MHLKSENILFANSVWPLFTLYRFTHIVVDHVTHNSTVSTLTPSTLTPVIFVTALEGYVFKYSVPLGGSTRSCLVEVLDLGCVHGKGRTTPRSIQLDSKQVDI